MRTLTPTELSSLVRDDRRCTVCLAHWMADPGFLCDCHASRDVNAAEREEARMHAEQVRCELAFEDGRSGDCFCGGHVPIPYTEFRAGRPVRSGIDWVRKQDFTPAEWDSRRAEYMRTFDDEEAMS